MHALLMAEDDPQVDTLLCTLGIIWNDTFVHFANTFSLHLKHFSFKRISEGIIYAFV